MTDSTSETAGTAPDATEPDTPATGTPDTVEAAQDDDGATEPRNREAAKYRRKLRDLETTVEAERAQWATERGLLQARLDHLHSLEAERLAAEHLADPADLWRDGVNLDQLRDTEGNLDHTKVTAAARGLLAQHPHWQRRGRTPTLDGLRSGATGRHTGHKLGWRDALAQAE